MRALTPRALARSAIVLSWLAHTGCSGAAPREEGTTAARPPAHAQTSNRNASSGDAYRVGFVRGCETECVATSSLPTCQTYCVCMVDRIEAEHREAHVDAISSSPERLLSDPWFQESLVACGAGIADEAFLHGCVDGAGYEAVCHCLLAELRAGMSREVGTRWMFLHMNGEPSPEAQIRIEQARRRCGHLAPGAASN